jgi:hypothetical protein
MDDEATYLSQLLYRYRWLLSHVGDEQATRAIESLIREAQARLDQLWAKNAPAPEPQRASRQS